MQLRISLRGFIFSLLACGAATVHASYFPTPLSSPDNSARFIPLDQKSWYATSISYEDGHATGGYDDGDNKKSFGSVYNNNGESFLAMLRNSRDDVQTKLLALPPQLLRAPDLGGRRGFVDVGGKIYHKQLTLAADVNLRLLRWIPGFMDAAVYMPFVSKKFNNVSFTQKSIQNVDAVDLQLNALMKDIPAFLKTYGNLSTEPWTGTGIGDPTLIVRWNMPYEQRESEVRRIDAHVHCGVQLPLAKKRDEDQMFSLPLGSDGLWGFPFGGRFEMSFSLPVKIGFGADFLFQIAESRLRRVKTALAQTNLFLLNKTRALLTPGLTWRAHWSIEGVNLWRGLGVRGMYEFLVHNNDQLSTTAAGYRTETINTASMNQKWYAQMLTAAVRYDLSKEFEKAPMTPYAEVYFRAPVGGKFVVNTPVLGLQINVMF